MGKQCRNRMLHKSGGCCKYFCEIQLGDVFEKCIDVCDVDSDYGAELESQARGVT